MSWLDRHKAKILDSHREQMNVSRLDDAINVRVRVEDARNAITLPLQVIGLTQALQIRPGVMVPVGLWSWDERIHCGLEPITSGSVTVAADVPLTFLTATKETADLTAFGSIMRYPEGGWTQFDAGTCAARAWTFTTTSSRLDIRFVVAFEAAGGSFADFAIHADGTQRLSLESFDAGQTLCLGVPAAELESRRFEGSLLIESPPSIVGTVPESDTKQATVSAGALPATEPTRTVTNEPPAATSPTRLTWDAPSAEGSRKLEWVSPSAQASEKLAWDVPAAQASEKLGWDAPVASASTTGKWDAPTAESSTTLDWARPVAPSASPASWDAARTEASRPLQIEHPAAAGSQGIQWERPQVAGTGTLSWDVPQSPAPAKGGWEVLSASSSARLTWDAPTTATAGTLARPADPVIETRTLAGESDAWSGVRSTAASEIFGIVSPEAPEAEVEAPAAIHPRTAEAEPIVVASRALMPAPFEGGPSRLAGYQPETRTAGTLPIPAPPALTTGRQTREDHPFGLPDTSILTPDPFRQTASANLCRDFIVPTRVVPVGALESPSGCVEGFVPGTCDTGTLPMPKTSDLTLHPASVESFESKQGTVPVFAPESTATTALLPQVLTPAHATTNKVPPDYTAQARTTSTSPVITLTSADATGNEVRWGDWDRVSVTQRVATEVVEWTTTPSSVPCDDYLARDTTSTPVMPQAFGSAPTLSVTGIHPDVYRCNATFDLPVIASSPIPVPPWMSRELTFEFDLPLFSSNPVRFDSFDEEKIHLPAPPLRQEVVMEPHKVSRWWAGRLASVMEEMPARVPNFLERLRVLLSPSLSDLLSDPELMLPYKPRPHQVQGVAWLYHRTAAAIADSIGLGKTMQALLAARLLWREGVVKSILVVAPKSLVSHWVGEVEKWWPQAKGTAVAVRGDAKPEEVRALLRREDDEARVKVVDYEALGREAEWLANHDQVHDLVICDDVQRMIDAHAPETVAVRSLKTVRRWALTGLDFEKNLPLAAALAMFLSPEKFETVASEELPKRLRGLVTRRTPAEVAGELPDLSEQDMLVDLLPAQRVAYARTEIDGVQSLRMKGDSATGGQAYLLVQRLRQICTIGPEAGESAKIERLAADLEEIAAAGHKAVVFVNPVGAARVAEVLASRGLFGVHVHEGLSRPRIEAAVAEFQNEPKWRVLMAPFTPAHCTALNVRGVEHVLLLDRGWNPVYEQRAIRRACQPTEGRSLIVRRYISRDTVEERIARKVTEGRRLFWHLVDESRPAEGLGLTEFELFEILGLRNRTRFTPPAPPRVVLEHLDREQFELMIATLYEKQGYKVTFGGAGVEGIDMIAEKIAPRPERVAIIFRHQSGVVAKPTLEQLWSLLQRERAFTQGDIVTSAGFMADCPAYIRGKKLTLIDRNLLQRQCEKLQVSRFVVAQG